MTGGDPRNENPYTSYSTPRAAPTAGISAQGAQYQGNDGGQGAAAKAQKAHSDALNAAEAQRVKQIQNQRTILAKMQPQARAPLEPMVSALTPPKIDDNDFARGLAKLGKQGQDYFAKSPLGTFFDGVSDVFGNDGQSYWESTAPPMSMRGGAERAEYMAKKPWWDQFTYSRTDEQRAEEARREKEKEWNPVSGQNQEFQRKGNGPDGVNGNMVGVTAPISGGNTVGIFGSGFGGGFTPTGRTGPANYFSALPDGIFNSGSSPALVGIQTSYGDSYNAADQWTSNGNATRAAQAAATTGET